MFKKCLFGDPQALRDAHGATGKQTVRSTQKGGGMALETVLTDPNDHSENETKGRFSKHRNKKA